MMMMIGVSSSFLVERERERETGEVSVIFAAFEREQTGEVFHTCL